MNDHLSTAVLHQLSHGLLGAEQLASSEAHLAVCTGCRQTLAAALKAAPLTGSSEVPAAATPKPRPSRPDTTAGWVAGAEVGRYRLLREIARGGMGEIWLAIERGPGGYARAVVIKRVIATADDDSQHASLFLDEARIAAQLHHPNIVQVFALGDHASSHFLVMEFLPGQSLNRAARRLRERGLLTPAIAVELVLGAARGLGYAHRKQGLDGQPMKIVHRDISPQNLFVTYEGEVKVLDFGIALAAGRMTRTATGLVRGKVSYMSPEQANGQPLDARSDVFSLGVVLWELLTGKRLWGETDEIGVLKQLAMESAPLPTLRAVVPETDPALTALLERALDRNPLARHADGHELADALAVWMKTKSALGMTRLKDLMTKAFTAEVAELPALYRDIAEPAPAPVPPPPPPEIESAATTPNRPRPRQRTWRPQLAVFGALALASVAGVVVLLSNRDAKATGAPPLAVGAPAPAAPPEPRTEPRPEPAPAPTPAVEATTDAGAAQKPKAAARRGALTIETEPWTRVFLGKRLLGETPLVEVPVPVGQHRLKLVNDGEGISTEVDVTIEPGRTTAKRYRLK